MIGGCVMIHLSGPSQELKERFQFYPTITNTNTTTNTNHWAQAQLAQHPAPLEREEGVYFVSGGDEGPASTHWDSGGGSSSFNTQNDDSSEDQAWPGCHEEIDPAEGRALELVGLLASCAESIGYGDNAGAVNYFLCRLGELASPRGLPVHRVAAYFTEALALRAAKLWPHLFTLYPAREFTYQTDDSFDDDDATALRLLDQVSPIPKFLHFTLNERLLGAFEDKERVHIIDFDIKEGLQWPGLLQSLAARPTPPAHVRVTGVGESRQELQDTGARLRAIAESLNLRFEFHPVVDKLEDVRLWMLHVKENECVAVNCVSQLHRALEDDVGGGDQGALTSLLGLIRSTNPSIVLVAEEEADHNGPRWEMRFANSLRYYSAVFDAVQSSGLPEDSASRMMVEEMFGRRIRNVVGCEGRERVERHERFDRWRALMGCGGFGCLRFGEGEAAQSRMLLRMYASGEHYSIEKRGEESSSDGLTLKFLDQPLYTVSAWAPL